jgi:hypothetical protein
MYDTRKHSDRRTARSTPMALILGILAACAGGPGDVGDPDVHQFPVDSIVLAPGQEARVDVLRLSFLEVTDDSRCPIDAVCFWQGNAAVHIALGFGMGPSSAFVLNTSEGTPSAVLGGFQVTLLALEPTPRTTVKITPQAYRASFRVATVN